VLTVSLPTTPSERTRKIRPEQPEDATGHSDFVAKCQTAFRQIDKWVLNRYPGTGINTFDFTVGVDFHYNKAKGKIALCHESSTNKFIADNDLQGLAPKEFPCTPELYKKVMAAPPPSTDEKEAMRPIKSAYLKYLGWAAHIASEDHGALGDNCMHSGGELHG
jgi:hypothetical protein